MAGGDYYESRDTVSWLHLKLLRPYAVVFLFGFVAFDFPNWLHALKDDWFALLLAPVILWLVGGPILGRSGFSLKKNTHLESYERGLAYEQRSFNAIARMWMGMFGGLYYLWITSSPAVSDKYADWRLEFWYLNVDYARKVVEWTFDLPLVQFFSDDTADRGFWMLLLTMFTYIVVTNWVRFQEAPRGAQLLLPVLTSMPLLLFWLTIFVYGPATDYDFPVEY